MVRYEFAGIDDLCNNQTGSDTSLFRAVEYSQAQLTRWWNQFFYDVQGPGRANRDFPADAAGAATCRRNIVRILTYFANNGTSDKANFGTDCIMIVTNNADETNHYMMPANDVVALATGQYEVTRGTPNPKLPKKKLRQWAASHATWYIENIAKAEKLQFYISQKGGVRPGFEYCAFDFAKFSRKLTEEEAQAADTAGAVNLSRAYRAKAQRLLMNHSYEFTGGVSGIPEDRQVTLF